MPSRGNHGTSLALQVYENSCKVAGYEVVVVEGINFTWRLAAIVCINTRRLEAPYHFFLWACGPKSLSPQPELHAVRLLSLLIGSRLSYTK